MKVPCRGCARTAAPLPAFSREVPLSSAERPDPRSHRTRRRAGIATLIAVGIGFREILILVVIGLVVVGVPAVIIAVTITTGTRRRGSPPPPDQGPRPPAGP
ncbi:hypothetical protein GCM10022205_08480 [Spinactinospora alkalitolerans]